MGIRGAENLSWEELERQLAEGGRFVFYEYCVSVIVATMRRPSEVYFLPASDLGIIRGLPYVLLSFCFGWWGIPFGLIYTPLTIFTNLCGGRELSEDAAARVLAHWQATASSARMVPCDESRRS